MDAMTPIDSVTPATATSVGTRFPVHALQNGGLIFPAQKEYRDHLHEVPEARPF